jgi:uncharacterized protein YpiB (UPF0302 family)
MKSERSHEQYMPNPSTTQPEKLVAIDGVYAQMVLDEILISRLKGELVRKIDESLDARDKEAFLKFSKTLNEISR